MNNLIYLLFFMSLISVGFPTFSEERAGKAVYETSAELGMKLNEKALKNIEVQTKKISPSNDQVIPLDSIVNFQDQIGVYRLRDGWFKLINIEILNKDNRQATVRTNELKGGDDLVIHGADLLRVAEMDAFGSGE